MKLGILLSFAAPGHAVAQIAALMDLGREQVAGFKILNFAVRGFVWCLSARLRAGHG